MKGQKPLSPPGRLWYTLPVLDEIPFLLYGFGKKGLSLGRLRRAWPEFHIASLKQVHSDRVVFLQDTPPSPPRADGAVTDRPLLFLIVKTADCLPLLLADPEKGTVAAVHCGWRGTARGIAGKAVRLLQQRCGCDPRSLRAGLGPCIGPSCYEVGEDVRQAFLRGSLPLDVFKPAPAGRGKYFLDLAAANIFQLKRAGLQEPHIDLCGLCTHCRPDLCSYRRDPIQTSRAINFIGFTDGRSLASSKLNKAELD
jgi:YfiH family protein